MSEILDRIYPDNESQLFFTEIADHRKYIIELEQQLQQAHRAGWEQAKREAEKAANKRYTATDTITDYDRGKCAAFARLKMDIAAMEYQEPTND